MKNKKIVIVLLLAILVATAGGIATYQYLSPKKIGIYVFKGNYAAGTKLTEDMLMVVQADATIYTAGAKNNASMLYATNENIQTVLRSGDSLRADVVQGMPLALSLLTANGGSQVEMNMDPTKVAVTVGASSVTGVTNDLKAGSRVNVYVTGSGRTGAYETILLFENMRVLAVAKNNNNSLTSLTLEVSRDDSMKLINYANSYAMYFGLVDGTGYEYSPEKEPHYAPEVHYDEGEWVDKNTEQKTETQSTQSTEKPTTTVIQPPTTEATTSETTEATEATEQTTE